MTIGHVVDEYLPPTQTFIYTLLRFQVRHQPVVLARRTANLADFRLDRPVVAPCLPPAPNVDGGGRMHSVHTRAYWAMHARRLAAAARRHGCAALHAHFGGEGYNTLRAREHLGVPLVTTFYGFDLALPRRDALWEERYARLFAEGDRFCVEGPAMADHLVSLGAVRDRVRVVPIGLDLEVFPFDPPKRTRPLVIFQAARFEGKKGFDLSIRAFAAARERLGDAELWLVGDGPLRGELEQLVEDLGMAGKVRFFGMVKHDRYRKLLAHAHIGIQPSRTAADGDTEGGAPTVLLEYQARGVPYVGTRHADIPAVTADPHTLVDEEDMDGLVDALVRVADATEDEWRDRAERARAFVEERHAAFRVAQELASLYDDLLGTSTDRSRVGHGRVDVKVTR